MYSLRKIVKRLNETKIKTTEEKTVADQGTTEYWTDYNVTLHHHFKDAADSLAFFHWRNDQYFNYIQHMPVSGFDDRVVLDYGCGPAHDLVGFSVYSKPKILIGADISQSSLAEAEARLRLHNSAAKLVLIDGNQSRLPFEDDYFDHIHSSGVLHHTPNLDLVMGELWRVLRPGGTINVMVYNHHSLWMHLFVAYQCKIINRQYSGLTLRQAFTKTTDSQDCPIADCYTPNEFISICERNGFCAKLSGVAISMHELNIAPTRFLAIQDRHLPEECRQFLLSLKTDDRGYPTYNGHYAGIDACFTLRKATAKCIPPLKAAYR